MDCTTKRLELVFGDLTLGVKGENFHAIFNYGTGGMESLRYGGREWVYRAPKPTFWRALTDNDRGSRFHMKSGCWLAADMYVINDGVSVALDGQEIPLPNAPENNKYNGGETAQTVRLSYRYLTQTVPQAKVTVTYTITADGKIAVSGRFFGTDGLPQLPVFGLRWIMPTKADGFVYEGLSGETYLDRMAGGVPGVYEVKGLPVTPYMVPQDCGMHMNTQWVKITRSTQLTNVKNDVPSTLKITAADGKTFAFSCLPYTAEELENAYHHEELPPARRTVLGIYGAVRGVGGIDSWGSDVEAAYHLPADRDYAFDFVIEM